MPLSKSRRVGDLNVEYQPHLVDNTGTRLASAVDPPHDGAVVQDVHSIREGVEDVGNGNSASHYAWL